MEAAGEDRDAHIWEPYVAVVMGGLLPTSPLQSLWVPLPLSPSSAGVFGAATPGSWLILGLTFFSQDPCLLLAVHKTLGL